MRVVSPLLKRVVYPSLAAGGYFRAVTRPGLAVVTYHGVFPAGYKIIHPGFDGNRITAGVFSEHLRLLKRRYAVISPEDMRAWCRGEHKLPSRAVLLTCDDGSLNNLTEMLPILQGEGLRCLFFVTGASAGERRSMLWYEELFLVLLRAPVGEFQIDAAGVRAGRVIAGKRQHLWWDLVKRLSQVNAETRQSWLQAACAQFGIERSPHLYWENYPQGERHFSLMTRAELQQLAAAGMTIGAHTLTHPILTQLPSELALNEIVESRSRLEAAVGREVWAFAYPFGDETSVTPEVVAMAQKARFEAAFVNTGGGLGAKLPWHAIPRVHVTNEMGLAEFEAHVSGFYQSFQRGVRGAPEGRNAVLDAPHI